SGGPRWHDLLIRPLDEPRVRQLAATWLEWPRTRFSEFSAWIDEAGEPRSRKLWRLAGQPYFALRLLFYFNSGPKLGTPLNHFDLMRFVVRRALDAVPAELLPQHDKPELMRRLNTLAFNMIDAGHLGAINKDRAASWLFAVREPSGGVPPEATPAQMEKAAQIWNIAARAGLLYSGGGQVGFDHQLTLESLCAIFLRERGLSDWLARACSPQFGEVWQIWSEGDSSLLPKLVTLLQEGSTQTARKHAAYALGQTRSPGAIRSLIAALDADPEVAAEAAHALGRVGGDDAVRALVVALKRGDAEVGLAASHALSWIGKPAVRPILDVLENIRTQSGVKDAVRALGEIGDERALDPLLKLLRKYKASSAPDLVKECDLADSRIRHELKKRFPLQS
ncbi:MAG: HEAT repeat domain-containing protein, partial [Bryobacteraceae bacterium]